MHSSDVSSPATVCIQKGSYDDIDIASLVKPLEGIGRFVKSGDRVLLKTNLLNATEPEKYVVTHPAVIGTVVKEVMKVGGIPVIGDSPSGPFTKRRLQKTYRKSGLTKLADALGVELNYDTRSKTVTVPDGRTLKKVPICNFISNADVIIALPKVKTHSLMMLTLATKIMFGGVSGLSKMRYHSSHIRRSSFADMLLDVLELIPPDLVIMDGIIGMQGNGPSGGDPADIGVLLASTNAVALDLAVCEMLGVEPMGIPTLKQAKLRKLWPQHILYPLLSPQDVFFKDFMLPSTAGYLLTGEKQPSRSPLPTEKCVRCGECVHICPRDAIVLEDIAKIDYLKCIKCYCCHEICAFNAIDLAVI